MLRGRAWSSIFYMRGWDELMPNVESIVAESEDDNEEGCEIYNVTQMTSLSAYPVKSNTAYLI